MVEYLGEAACGWSGPRTSPPHLRQTIGHDGPSLVDVVMESPVPLP